MISRKLATFSLCILFSIIFFFINAHDLSSPQAIYSQIKDIYQPTLEDYYLIQDYLIIGNSLEEQPVKGLIAVNCDLNTRENCFVIYSSFNKNYPRGLKRLVNYIAKSDYTGHIRYQLGGWPNVEGGSLVLAHVPYAFKASFFKEVQRLGYKRVFWLDTAILPYVSLNEIFQMIEEKGYFAMANTHMIGPWLDPNAAEALGITMEEASNILSCCGGLFGADFTTDIGTKIVDLLYESAFDPQAYFSPRQEQNVLSVILYKLGLSDSLTPISKMAHNKDQINSETLFLIEREFVNELSLK